MSLGKLDPVQVGTTAVSAAMQAGADGADAFVRFANELTLEVRNGEIENLKRATTRGLGLRVTHDGRTAMVHTTDVDGLPLIQLAARAVEIARAVPRAEEPVARSAAQEVAAFAHPDPDLVTMPVQSRLEYLLKTEQALRAVSGVTGTYSVSWGEVDGETALVNSRGLELYAPLCRIECGVEGVAEAEGESYTGGRYAEVPARRDLPDPGDFGREAGERAIEMLGARPIASTHAPVIFHRYVGWALLRSIVGPLLADAVAQGRSYFADARGTLVASPEVTIRDNPHLRTGPYRRAFDAEGTPTRDLAIINGGRLEHFLTDLKHAAELDLPATGNAVRDSYDGGVEIGTSNFYLEPGTLAPGEIIKETPRGLLLTGLSGWWVGLSPARDEFSSAAMGFWIEDGQPVQAVRGISIAGSLREMLRMIDRVGSDLEPYNGTRTPTFRIADMTIAGV